MGNGTEGTDEAPRAAARGAIDEAELRRWFMNRPAQDMANVQRQAIVTEAIFAAAMAVVTSTPPGRAQAEALTHLEAASLWAHHAIDRHETHKA